MLPDHKGPYFSHQNSRLVQRQIKDEDGQLIAPHELYGKLVEGTLFSAQITLSTYINKESNPRFLDTKVNSLLLHRSFQLIQYVRCTTSILKS